MDKSSYKMDIVQVEYPNQKLNKEHQGQIEVSLAMEFET